MEGPNKIWRLTGIYGEPRWEDMHQTLDRIRAMHAQHNLPWVIIGDFNEILYSHEKEGSNLRPHNLMQAFRNALSDCNLEDIGFTGDAFTWRRGRIRERLDRAVANNAWSVMHPGARLQNLDFIRLDHRPILLDTDALQYPSNNVRGTKKFEAKWLQEPGFGDVVKCAWETANQGDSGGWRVGQVRSHARRSACLGQ
jgi:hypothetical protein